MKLLKSIAPSGISLGLMFFMIASGFAAEEIYQLKGNRVESREGGTSSLIGEAALSQGDYQIFADRIDWDPITREVVASGNIKIVRNEATLQGDSLSLNLQHNTGKLQPARGNFKGYFLSSDGIDILPQRLIAVRAAITTCDREEPHYSLRASKIIVFYSREAQGKAVPERLQLQGGRLQYRGRNILPLPKFQINLAQEADSSEASPLPIPYPGYSSADGLFLGYHWSTGWQENRTKLSLDWRTTARRGMRAAGYFYYSLGKSDYLRLTLSRREDLRDEYLGPKHITSGLSKVLVNREPEIAVDFAARPLTPRLAWQTTASYGHYQESPTGVSADRSALTTGLQFGPLPVGKKLSFNAATAYRFASYDNSDTSRVLYGRLTAKFKPEPDWQLQLSLVGRGFKGDSPFRFDQVDFSRELAAELACPLGKNWQGRFINRYDLKRNETRDVGVELIYRAHCLDYSLGWRSNRDLIEFGISLARPEVGSEEPVAGSVSPSPPVTTLPPSVVIE